MSTSIAMGVRSPDIVGQLARSAQAAGIQNGVARENRLMDLYREQGPQIAAGDPGAVNALAQHSPQEALGIKETLQGMEVTEENLRMTRDRFRKLAEADAKKASAEEAAAAAAEIEQIVALAIADPANADAIFASDEDTAHFVGLDPRVAGASLLGLKDALEMAAPPKPADEYGRYVQEETAAGRQPLSRIDYAQAKKGQETIEMADGKVTIKRGGGQSGERPKLTVDAAKNTGFYIRTKDAHQTITDLESQGLEFLQQNADAIPFGLGNYMRTPEFQRFDQARRDFVNAILRRESGAVISDQEFDNAEKQYFPQPGDSPEVIQQKRRNRANAIEGLKVGSGAGADYVDQQKPSEASQAVGAYADFTMGQLRDNVPTTEEEAVEWNRRYEELGGQ
ncbi:MAG: hypothetical protein ACPGSI_18460 [Pikeienuella sp.]